MIQLNIAPWQYVVSGILAIVIAPMFAPPPAIAAEEESAIARGGRLYDKWFKENKAEKPTTDHAAYPHPGGKYGKDASWRCKECHGWDYRGNEGAYASGKHATGIKGIRAAAGKDPKEIADMLRKPPHGYTEAQLSATDSSDLALFVSKGQIDFATLVEADGKPKGDGAKGEAYFNTLCAGCHGTDGTKIKEAPLGPVSGNAVEMIHKILNGQPGEAMPALRALDPQISADIAVHLQTLPK
ncbi:MAG: c-type cytochrome [Hyphomicrobiaceae bacterium]|nr:c-type cytochrome [Hyphomicrobiaceae bacterium]MCC0010937.1 c-type cytochrome [Hyphomicrobiaceae bacterium]